MSTSSPAKETISRRSFLGSSGAALGGVALAGAALGRRPPVAAAVDTAPRKVRIGVVGGGFGRAFLWHEHPDCVVEAVSDLRDDRRVGLMERFQCEKSYPSLEELIKDPKIDAVALFTAPPDHVRHTVACMRAGKHVLSAVTAFYGLDWREQCEELIASVEETGLTYMMAETTYWHQSMITARTWLAEGKFGNIFYSEAEYLHPGNQTRTREQVAPRDWGYGAPPMWYLTHCTAHLIGLTGERFTSVSCTGHGEAHLPKFQNNSFGNPHYIQQALFVTDKGNSCRIMRGSGGAIGHCDRASWYGEKLTYVMRDIQGLPLEKHILITNSGDTEARDDAGFRYSAPQISELEEIEWWKTDMLPEPLRHDSGHQGSHTFITHEFIEALVQGRRPAVDVYEAVAYTVPGFVAHESAMDGGVSKKVPQFDRKLT